MRVCTCVYSCMRMLDTDLNGQEPTRDGAEESIGWENIPSGMFGDEQVRSKRELQMSGLVQSGERERGIGFLTLVGPLLIELPWEQMSGPT